MNKPLAPEYNSSTVIMQTFFHPRTRQVPCIQTLSPLFVVGSQREWKGGISKQMHRSVATGINIILLVIIFFVFGYLSSSCCFSMINSICSSSIHTDVEQLMLSGPANCWGGFGAGPEESSTTPATDVNDSIKNRHLNSIKNSSSGGLVSKNYLRESQFEGNSALEKLGSCIWEHLNGQKLLSFSAWSSGFVNRPAFCDDLGVVGQCIQQWFQNNWYHACNSALWDYWC